ncbi:uncharacterized protein LOC143882870 [Tasmannia lanceolata]|uniref:uncharacterized protein LOC143882870 n=1 Tax=Tasmannia lanceolata TaxID=3420 RepID=UPI004063D59C
MAGRKSARVPAARTTLAVLPGRTRSERLASLVVAASATAEQNQPRSVNLNSMPTPEQVQALFQHMTALVGQYQQLLQAPPQPPPEAPQPVLERPEIHRGESSRRSEDRTHHSPGQVRHPIARHAQTEPHRCRRSRSRSAQRRRAHEERAPQAKSGSRRRSPESHSGSAAGQSVGRNRSPEHKDDPMMRRIEEMGHRIEELAKDPSRPVSRAFSSRTPFTDDVMGAPAPRGFKMPSIPQYDGTTDLVDHLETFRTLMLLHGALDGFLCRAFPTTLTGAARDWYSRIRPNSINNFDDFGEDLVRHFMSSRRPRKTAASLMTLRQEDNEPLKAFVSRFNREALQVPDLDPSAATNALLAGARSNDFRRAVARRNPHSLADLMSGAEEYISVEETLAALDSSRRRTSDDRNQDRHHAKQRRDDKVVRRDKSPHRREENFTPLNTSRRHILAAISGEEFIKWPTPMISKGNRRDKSKYCRFHRDHGHDTDDCRQLKEEIEQLISRGYLKKYVRSDTRGSDPKEKGPQGRSPRRSQPPPVRRQSPSLPSPPSEAHRSQPRGVIGTIMGGPAAGGTSSAARKAYVRRVNAVHACSKKAKTENEISFSDADLDGLILPHDDALVLTMLVANWELKKILVDNGSSADILYYHTFERMMIGDDRLKPANSDLFGFSGEVVKVEGPIELPVLVGEPPCQAFAMVNFLVVRATSVYNAILGRPGQNLIRAVASAYHPKMKFITPNGVGEVRGDQPQSRECYAMALKGRNATESLPIELLDLRDEAQGTQPAEDLVSVPLCENDDEKVVQIGSSLDDGARHSLTQFLQDNADVFAWAPTDMPGINPEVSSHRLGVDPTCRPVKQKKRHFALERQMAIREEVERLLRADFIREIQYPDWLANVVLVKKANGKWRTCVDFTDLNKACPKDSYPLPKIDQLIDATAGHELLSFMDAFSGYNQIKMYESDIPKTSFVTDQGTYCYRVMPFGLKNAGATYQRLVNKLFRNQIGRNMEVYVDDMLVKSLSSQDHVSDLEETFQVLRDNKMKLNPTKCTFGVSSGKFLGFMVSQRGIEANPEKIKAVVELAPPKTIREVQRLTGMIAALGRFVSKSAERCLPFFNAVKGLKTSPWTEECQTSFEELKQYLSSPPLLTKPEPGEELILYLSISPLALAAVIVREERSQQKPVYYVSKALHDAEIRYQRVEKLAYALVMAARKLRPYFQAHTIKVLTDQPLRQVLHKPDTSGRLVKWAVELSEFDIRYMPRPAIKAQVLADFVAECSIPQQIAEPEIAQAPAAKGAITAGEPGEDGARAGTIPLPPVEHDPSIAESLWEVHVDGSSNKAGCGAGLVLTGPDGFALDYALRFGFRASNNEAEYEPLLAGMNLAVQTGAQRLKAYCDSQLVANQIQGIYEARDERMIKYLSQVRQLSSKFRSFEVVRIPRTDNTKADVLSKLAASGYTTLGNICMEFLQASSIERKAAEIMQVEHEPCWMDEIVDYLRSGKLPEAKREVRKVIQRAARFSLDGENLFKRSYTLPHLKCLWPGDATYALQETHEDELYHVLWAYRTTPRTPTGESPFNLSFGTEAVIPVDVGTPSVRISNFNEQLNGDGLRANLDLLEEAREESRIRVAAYKQKVSRYHDSKIRPREFRVRDLVLRKAAISQPKKAGKLFPT